MDARSFFEYDFGACLFPLTTNLLLVKHHHPALQAYVAKVLSDSPAHIADNFLPQTRVHAAKPRNHLRRTVVLDPVATYFIYDLISRNRTAFGNGTKLNRTSFGYTFGKKKPVAVSKAYRDFLKQMDISRAQYDHRISFDIASYFNSIYHHDATNWFAALSGVSGPDANAFGRFFREINAGRSVDFLPQGIYPTKMIGNEFLRFVDLSGEVKSAQLLRFMDDFHLFDDDLQTVVQDFLRIQELLGLKGLNVNPAKTALDAWTPSIHAQASAIQEELASIVEGDFPQSKYLGFGSGTDMSDFYSEDEEEKESLDDAHVARLHELLMDPRADESDVELILGILHKNTEDVTAHLSSLLARFPNIVKQLHKLAGSVDEKEQLADEILELLKSGAPLIEYQHFWIAVIAEDHLSGTKSFGDLVLKLYERTAEHKIARAKVLEIPDHSFGLKEIRDGHLKTGASDWLAWAAAVGTRSLKRAERNYALKYFSKGSPLNYLVAECVENLP
jgi:hypothetical protein